MPKRISGSGLAVTVLGASLVLSACGGGGGGGSDSSGGDATTLKAGLYDAKITRVNGSGSQTARTYLSPTGELAIDFRGEGLSFGMLEFDRPNITGASIDYRQFDEGHEGFQPDARAKGFLEDKDLREGAIRGTINSQGSATFSTVDAAGEVNTDVTLKRENFVSDFGISLTEASGNYEQGVSEVVLTVGADGSLTAQYFDCQLLGTQARSLSPASSVNVFNITYTMSGCDNDIRNGDYSGLGFFAPTSGGGQGMKFAAHNGKVAMRFIGNR
jgi:hypothetical protein